MLTVRKTRLKLKEPNVGGSEMASREKRPLVPSKSKQKASESSISSPDNKTKKGKTLPNLRQQIARDILEAVATGSKLPPKLEASLPRKKALEKLKRNKELRSRVTLIKAKQKVGPIKGARKINTEAKKTVKPRKVKQSASAETKLNESGVKGGTTTENSNVNTDNNEGKGTEANAKSAKIVTKTIKKTKATKISSGDNETSELHDSLIIPKVNQKTGKKQSDSLKSAGKTVKTIGKKLGAKETGNSGVLLLWDTKSTKPKKNLAKDTSYSSLLKNTSTTDKTKTYSEDSKNSIDLTIEEVIASMLSDPEIEESEEKEDSKTTKTKKMMVGERSFCDVEIKKEKIDCEDETTEGRCESSGIEQIIQMQIPVQARKKATPTQRSLRNGKLRQLSDSGISIDIEMKKGGRLNSDEHSMEQENTSDGNIDTESCFSESSVNESRINVLSTKDNLSVTTKEEKNHLDEVIQFVSEIENNNNSDQVDTTVEARPALRSKVKTRISDEMPTDEMKIEDSKSTVEYPPINFMQIVHIPKRRNSLNTSTKKRNPFAYSFEKSDGSSKSQIDQMIEDIKLTIAKSIESKIYGQEKGKAFEGLSKSFDVPKIEEVVAPLSAEVQKVGLEERNEEEMSNIAEQKVKSDNSENSVPKVADTAKEIEKLVMGENQSVDSQSQKKNTDHQEIVHQTTSKEIAENVANTSQVTQSSNEVAISNSEHENNLKKPGRSKTTQELSSEKIDCIVEEKILKSESSQIEDSMNTSNLTADSETSIVLNISSITEEEVEEEVENLETISVKVESNEKTKIVQMTQVPLSEIRNSEQNNELKAVSCPKTDSVSLNEEINSPSEKEHVNSNQLLTDGCDNAATSAQTKLTHSSSETEKLTASNNDSSLNITNKESSPSSISLSSTSSSTATTTTTSSPSSSSSLPESQDPKNPKEEEQKVDDNKRVLRGREKQKKIEPKEEEKCDTSLETQSNGSLLTEEKCQNKAQSESDVPVRTRRTRESKKPAVNTNLKPKRNRKEVKKSDQQNKEETLLDNEVAKINENKYRKSVEEVKTPRGCSVPSTNNDKNQENKSQDNTSSNRSKSENDLENMQNSQRSSATSNGESFMPKDSNNENSTLDIDEKNVKTLDNLQKDSDEASTSGESLSSIIQETPEEKARKETVFRLLGLESWEKAAERLNHQKAKREQTSGLKMRIPKGRDKDKMRSRSPLKMVLKQGRADGEGDSPEFYTIQKECGTSVGESSSDEDNEESQSKDRQSLVIPEKSSSFSIHPGRCCGDVCCYCFGKFGSLDTPMHLAQMKSDERRQKILNLERHLTKDSCLCDACYRHIDRKANQSPTNIQTKPQKQHRQYLVPKCCARGCLEPARHHVRRRWLQKVKVGLRSEVDINWESNPLTSMSFCVTHYPKVAKFLNCGLCKRRLQKNQSFPLNSQETIELNRRFTPQGMDIPTTAGTFVCKLCRCFTSLQLKYKDIDNMHKTNKEFYKKYKAKILSSRLSGGMDNEMDDMPSNQESKEKEKEKQKKVNKNPTQTKNSALNSKPSNNSSNLTNPSLEKMAVKTNKQGEESSSPITVIGRSEQQDKSEIKNSASTSNSNESPIRNDVQFVAIEKTIEKLKKRKALEALSFTSTNTSESSEGANVVEILAMDKEVTLTRLPKKMRTNNDITPVVQRLGANPSISVRTLFPGEEEMNLHANIEFGNVREVTPQGWEKCATMIQYDRDTKLLWQELQRPYGNQSSFLRHLILLEKYYRSGDLVLAPNASRNAINYSTSVHNRLISYEGPEKVDEPIMEPVTIDYTNARRLSGGFVVERDRVPPTNTTTSFLTTSTPNLPSTSQTFKTTSPRTMKINPGVSIMKKPPTLQRLSFPSTSGGGSITPPKRQDPQKSPMQQQRRGKAFELSEMSEYKRLLKFKQQKQQTLSEKNSRNISNGPAGIGNNTPSPLPGLKPVSQNQKSHYVPQTQFQKHLRMQQEMLNRQSRSDFEPLVCDMRQLSNENTPTQNFLGNLNLPKSIQVTTKPSIPIPILPKIPKSLTVIPQTVPRPIEK
ncbi:serine-rich adhesin for platelets isoform X2 [Leptopilina heterotoma]|uniref:serine-rich adhesin for platelets isoform X2 n=1 Tax=Leptopilina heterotoma TaxID=63436 RepID=UPI001CA8EFC2|nr:serine-rich adhesin for platelets isoform X2 [Leptopilina heterotoma]